VKRKTVLKEIVQSDDGTLQTRVQRLEGELLKLRIRKATNQLENTMQIRQTRREIATILQVLGERKKKA